MKKKNTQVTKCYCLYLYGYPWYFALKTDNSQLKNTITSAIPATHITATHTHTHNISIVRGTKVTCVIIYEPCVGNVLFLLPISRSEEAASHSITIPMVIAASGTKVKVNSQNNYSLRIDLKVQQRET